MWVHTALRSAPGRWEITRARLPEWREIVERAFAGARGKNYIGTRERVESLSDAAAVAR